MTELDPRLSNALAQIGDAWTSDRSERNLAGTRVRHRRLRRRRSALGGSLGACLVLAAIWIAWPRPITGPQPSVAGSSASPLAAAGPMQFQDGSRIELLDAAGRVVVDEVTRELISVRLLSGRVRVEVVRRPERAFRVECGAVSVSVLGTAFELTRDGERTHVSVLRGRVAVEASDGSHQLSGGEAGWFPRSRVEGDLPRGRAVPDGPTGVFRGQLDAVPLDEPSPRSADDALWSARPERARGRALPRRAASQHEPAWQIQAKRGDYKRAFELMPAAPGALADDIEALLLAADAARLSGHPAPAVPYLRRVIERHPHDSRAALAAFTLGGVLLNQLDRPREADAAYAQARSLALSPALAQDALARQVGAAERAGDAARVRQLAGEYLRRYPDGRRVQWVRETSGL